MPLTSTTESFCSTSGESIAPSERDLCEPNGLDRLVDAMYAPAASYDDWHRMVAATALGVFDGCREARIEVVDERHTLRVDDGESTLRLSGVLGVNLSIVLSLRRSERVRVLPYERLLLNRVALHLENAAYLRRSRCIRGAVSQAGELLAPETDPAVRSAQSLRLWLDLICGRASLARSDESGEQYFVLDAPPAWTAHRALTDTQSRVVALSAHGAPYKYIANMLGLSPPSVSRALRIAAAKIGVQTPFELIRLASGLAVEQKTELPERTLTVAEEAVLELVILGLSNRAIAQLRGRSTRTIANQVASLLRKMRCPSRRALATSVRPPRANPSEIAEGTDEDA